MKRTNKQERNRIRGITYDALNRPGDKWLDFDEYIKILGCSVNQLRKYYFSQFTEEMKGRSDVQADHRIPLNVFDLTDPVQFHIAANYRNVQPLISADNSSKGYKVIKEEIDKTGFTPEIIYQIQNECQPMGAHIIDIEYHEWIECIQKEISKNSLETKMKLISILDNKKAMSKEDIKRQKDIEKLRGTGIAAVIIWWEMRKNTKWLYEQLQQNSVSDILKKIA